MVKAWVVLLTIVLIFFTTRFFFRMANQASVPKLEGFGLEDAEESQPGWPNYQVSTINHFLQASMTGKMPGGNQTSQPLFPKEYTHQFSTKYVDWAPPPFDKLSAPQMELASLPMGPIQGDSPAPIIRIMHVVSGMDRMFNTTYTNASHHMKLSPKAVRSKLWWGMAPISDSLWKSKDLDKEESVEEAMAIIQQTVDVFKHQLKPEVQGDMRTTHNRVWTEFDVFQDAIVALRSNDNESAPEFNIAKLWQEYSEFHFQNMENQARAWAFKRLNILFKIWKDRMMRVMQSGRRINETQGTIKIDHWAMMIINKLLDLFVDAEIYLRTCTAGFSMIKGIHQDLIGAITLAKSETQLNATYARMENKRVSDLRGVLAAVLQQRTAARRAAQPTPSFLEAPGRTFDREFAMRGLMTQMDNPLPLGVEAWVEELSDDERWESFGFVVYCNACVSSDVGWKNVMETAEAGISSGWDGVLDPKNVKRKTMLHWIDGKQEGIPEDDIEAVRSHFKAFISSPDFPSKLTTTVCLSITSASYKSFTNPSRKGDYRGFLAVIDANYDPASESEGAASKPGFSGHFNIVDQLVWTDLFALQTVLTSQHIQDYWRLAACHPWAVYMGPTTGVKRKQWRLMDETAKGMGFGHS